jgi:hypothetical protein
VVKGLEKFREYFEAYPDRYVLIGGTAAALAMEQLAGEFRATKDLDIVLTLGDRRQCFKLILRTEKFGYRLAPVGFIAIIW